jgi:hypothetical protein
VTGPAAAPWPAEAHDRLTEAISYADGILHAVTPQLLSRPTPCHAWNLRMHLEHADESLAALYEGVTDGWVTASPLRTSASGSGASSAAALVSAVRQHAAALLHASAQADGDAPVTIGGHPIPSTACELSEPWRSPYTPGTSLMPAASASPSRSNRRPTCLRKPACWSRALAVTPCLPRPRRCPGDQHPVIA